MIKSKSFCAGLLAYCCCVGVYAQFSQPLRFEQEHKDASEEYIVVGLEEDGIALVQDLQRFNQGNPQWQFMLIDTLMQEKLTLTFDVNPRQSFAGYDHTKGYFHLLYKGDDQTNRTLELITIDLSTGEIKESDIKTGLALELTHFYMVGTHAIIGGYVNREPTVILFDPTTNQSKALPGFIEHDISLMDIRVNENNTFDVVLSDRSVKSDRQIIYRTYDENGVQLLEDVAKIDSNKVPQTAISSRLKREDLMIVGTWGSQNSKQSLGFYTMPIDPFNKKGINYFYAADFDHFLDFMNSNRAERIKTKTDKAAKDGRVPDYSNYMAPFELSEYKGGYLMLAQIYSTSVGTHTNDPYGHYYPDYYYFNYGSIYNPFYRYPGPYMQPYDYSDRVEHQTKVYEIALIAFDGDGKRLWDVSCKPADAETETLKQIGQYYYRGDSVVLMYRQDSKIHSSVIDLVDETVSEHTTPIKLKNDTDELRDENEDRGGFDHWYKNAYFVWGYQSIRNTTNKGDRNRDVFYINKIVLP